MDLTVALKFAGSVVAAFGGPTILFKIMREMFPDPEEKQRALIGKNLDLLERMPDDSGARQRLLESLDQDVELLIGELRATRRDFTVIILGIIFTFIGIGLGFWAWTLHGAWQIPVWIGAAMTILFGVAGGVEGAKKQVRDVADTPAVVPDPEGQSD